MNKNEIKQIILEEIEAALQEMNENMSPEDMAADSRPEEGDEIEGPGPEDMPGAKVTPFVTDLEARIARAMETGDEDDLEDLAAGELDRAGLDEMARTANVFALAREASIKDVLGFMQRVNNLLKTYKSPGQKRPKKRFTPEEMKALAKVMLQDGGFTSKDIIAATSYNSPAQANKFLAALEQKGLIKLTSQLKKSMKPERDPDAPETRGRKAKSAEFDVPDDALDMDFGDFEDLDLGDIGALEEKEKLNEITTELIGQYGPEAVNGLYMLAGVLGLPIAALLSTINDGDPLEIKDTLKDLAQSTGSNIKAKAQAIAGKLGLNENNNTMTNLEKYIKQQIKEAKNPLAKKMKEIENQGRIAALETKLAAIAEMIEETNTRLTRIDEDNEFRDMMDKNAVKEVRKQLKELERAKLKLEKEYAKAAGGRKKEKIVDEDTPVAEDNFALNEISNDTVISAIRQALQRKEFKRAQALSNGLYKDFIGKNAGPNLGILKEVKVDPVRDLGDLAGESIKGMFRSVQFNFENPDIPGQSGRTQILLKGLDQNYGTMTYSNSGASMPIEELELTRQEVRFIQKMILFIDPTNTKWTKGTSGYNVAGLRESVLRMQKLAGIITESDIKKKLSLNENRTFKQNPVNIPGVDPKVAAILDKNIPDEVAGSFDDANMQFVAPFDSEELVIADGPDLLDAIGFPESGLTPKDLPTEYVEIPPSSFEGIDYKGFRDNPYLLPTDGSLDDNTGRNLEARTFAKYVPGKGLMYKFITKEV